MFRTEDILNPYNLQRCSDEELSKAIDDIVAKYRYSDMPYDVAYNIEIESDLLTIYGEFIARLQKEASLLKFEADNQEAKAVYRLRKDWLQLSNDKAPAMSYFEAQAREQVADIRKKQIEAESMLTRFKKSYESLETKQNALKKKLDAMKYEVV